MGKAPRLKRLALLSPNEFQHTFFQIYDKLGDKGLKTLEKYGDDEDLLFEAAEAADVRRDTRMNSSIFRQFLVWL